MSEYTLLAGGAGYIGCSVAYLLLKSDKNVIIVDNLQNADISRIENLPNQSSLTFIQMDILTQIEEIRDKLSKYNITSIIHFAGLKAVGESVQYPLKYYRENINITLNLLKLAKELSIPKFIFSSSATVYGDSKPPLTEESAIGKGITNPYGKTKYFIEEIIRDFSISYDKCQFIILRYFNPVGFIEGSGIYDDPKNPNNLFPVIIKSIRDKKPFTVFGKDYDTPDGTAQRDYIDIEDLARGHIASLNYNTDDKVSIFNLGTGAPLSVLDIIETIECVNNISLDYTLGDRRIGDLPSVYCKPDLAFQKLSWKAYNTITMMCRLPPELIRAIHG